MPCWGDETYSDGRKLEKDFFVRIDTIALQIGEDLKAAGISVSQTKEKFGEVRVYLTHSGKLWEEAAIANAYEKAIKKNKDIDPSCILDGFEHELFNKEWADLKDMPLYYVLENQTIYPVWRKTADWKKYNYPKKVRKEFENGHQYYK